VGGERPPAPSFHCQHICQDSVKFCHRAGLTYVSCSPFRVPVARLAAAQAAIEEQRKAKTDGGRS